MNININLLFDPKAGFLLVNILTRYSVKHYRINSCMIVSNNSLKKPFKVIIVNNRDLI